MYDCDVEIHVLYILDLHGPGALAQEVVHVVHLCFILVLTDHFIPSFSLSLPPSPPLRL